MNYSTAYFENENYYLVKVTGVFQFPEDPYELQSYTKDLMENSQCKHYLFDSSNAEVKGSVTDTYSIGAVPCDSDGEMKKLTIAIVHPKEDTLHKFLEDVFNNKGYNVQMFTDKQSARDWLTQRVPQTQL